MNFTIKNRLPKSINLAIAVVIVSRLLSWLALPNGSVQPDSFSYLPKSWLSFEKVSFFGNAERTWVTPLIYSLLPDNTSRIFLQLTIGAISWSIIILSLMRITRNSRKQNYLVWGVVLIAASPHVIQFETVLLATTFIVDGFLIFVVKALEVFLSDKYSKMTILQVLLLGWLLFSMKSTNALIVFPVMIAILVKSRNRFSRRLSVTLTLISVLLVVQASYLSVNNDRFWKSSYSGTTMLWHLGVQSPASESFKAYLVKKSAPECITANAPYADIFIEISKIDSECIEGQLFVKTKLKYELASFLIQNPTSALKLISTGIGVVFTGTNSHYGSSVSLLPSVFSDALFGSVSPDFRSEGVSNQSAITSRSAGSEPLWVFTPGLFFALIGVICAFYFRKIDKRNYYYLLAMILVLGEIIVTLLILPSEWFRQNVQYTLALFLISALSLTTNYQNFASTGNRVREP